MKPLKPLHLASAALILFAVTWISGCATRAAPRPIEITPRFLPDVERSARPHKPGQDAPTIALVLGGGGLRGFAHLGVIRALEESGIQPDIVVGTSAGAVVGAAYASGLSPNEIETIARNVKLSSLIDLTVSASGLMRGDNIARWIDTVTSGKRIEAFPRRFGAVATDLRSGQAVLLDNGSPGVAVQASAAVPGVNVPVAYPGGHFVDGGITSLVPVRFARAMGADVVIAVDVYCADSGGDGMGAASVLLRVMRTQSCLIAAPEMAEADVLIAPKIHVSSLSAQDEQEKAIWTGYRAALAALSGIKSRMKAPSPAAREESASSLVSRSNSERTPRRSPPPPATFQGTSRADICPSDADSPPNRCRPSASAT
ncbi:hypothetical protein CDN99_05795 [Roseateles aquatilis]|uniref:PNPLA domain-containing protein n=1 Tax=Roseateles aquatilis TaxID=431061 RepID=A0A246JH54_9BURK|nr:patatin-like phospholipase family protein [Roseateles aquatilis]OWQ91882.1 hypothetical protein CDN99_05795 [Roseateles aquatilis]